MFNRFTIFIRTFGHIILQIWIFVHHFFRRHFWCIHRFFPVKSARGSDEFRFLMDTALPGEFFHGHFHGETMDWLWYEYNMKLMWIYYEYKMNIIWLYVNLELQNKLLRWFRPWSFEFIIGQLGLANCLDSFLLLVSYGRWACHWRRASRELDVGVPQYLRRRWSEYPNYPFHANRTSTQGFGKCEIIGQRSKDSQSRFNAKHLVIGVGLEPLQPMPADARWLLSIPLNPAWRSDILFEMFDPKKKGEVSYSAPGGLWQGFRHPNIWLCLK